MKLEKVLVSITILFAFELQFYFFGTLAVVDYEMRNI